MALNAALRQLIETKLAHTHEPQWALPITEVRQAFRNLWTPAITGEPVSLQRIEDVTVTGADGPILARVYAPDGPEACWKAGHVPGCPCRAGGDVELREGWISYEDEDGITVEVEVKG
jgi:hypothetical protein